MKARLLFRLILDEPRPAALNMAIDEMLMEGQAKSSAKPVLRIYFWDRPSISAGYFQDIHAITRRFRCAEKKIPVVRRLTGGGLVFHGKDLTFSICLKAQNPFLPQDTKSSYQKVNQAIYEGLRHQVRDLSFVPRSVTPSGRGEGETVCFEKPTCFDLVMQGKKIVGASQRRTQKAVLHQSAVFLDLGHRALAERLVQGFKTVWKIDFKVRGLTKEELKKAAHLERKRYYDPKWALPIF